MSPSELLSQFRGEVDDPELPGSGNDSDSLWKDSEIYGYMDEGQKAFVRDTDFLADVLDVSVIANDAYVDIDPNISKVRRARLRTAGAIITPTTLDQLETSVISDDYGSNVGSKHWEDLKGTPRYLIMDAEFYKGRLVPCPVKDDILDLHVFRKPDTIVNKDSTIEVEEIPHIRTILMYMKYLAYDKQDVDTVDENMSDRFMSKYLDTIKQMKYELQRTRRNSGSGIRYGGL